MSNATSAGHALRAPTVWFLEGRETPYLGGALLLAIGARNIVLLFPATAAVQALAGPSSPLETLLALVRTHTDLPLPGRTLRFGIAICYDIRFPKLFAELSRRGARLAIVSASWGAGPGKVEQWERLARARPVRPGRLRLHPAGRSRRTGRRAHRWWAGWSGGRRRRECG